MGLHLFSPNEGKMARGGRKLNEEVLKWPKKEKKRRSEGQKRRKKRKIVFNVNFVMYKKKMKIN